MTYLEEEKLLQSRREGADRIMLGTLVFLLCIMLGVAAATGTWGVALAVGIPALAVPFVIARLAPASLVGRLAIAAAFMVFSALLIQETRGLIEAHFLIFVLLAFLLYYRDWRPILMAAAVIAVHHLVFDILQAQGYGVYVFNYGNGFAIVLLHAVFVVFEAAVLIYMAVQLRSGALESALIAELAAEVKAGRLVPPAGLQQEAAQRRALQAVLDMQLALGQTFRDIQQQSDTMLAAAESMGRRAREVGATMVRASDAAAGMATGVEELTQAVNALAEQAASTSALAQRSGQAAEEGARVVRAAIDEIGSIAATIQSSSANVERLGAQSDRVASVVGLIKDIAGQTNLLALNAAIEAARAGEQGRGFAVVADEVRKLAERTSHATDEIDTMIKEIQESKSATLASIAQAVEQVETGVRLATDAGRSIEDITREAQSVRAAVDDMASHLRAQSATAIKLAQDVEVMARLTEESRQAAAASVDDMQQLEQVAGQLKTALRHFETR